MTNSNTKSNFVQGAFILIVANAVTKLIGAIFKIPLTNLIGANGMGIFTVAYSIYTALFVIATAGLPVAISKMVAESNAVGKHEEATKIVKVALRAFSIFGLCATAVLFFGAETFAKLVGNEPASFAVMAVAPSLFFVSLMAIIRGYYQGLSNMVPTAISQILEACGKLVVGYIAAFALLKAGYGIEIAAAGGIAGVTFGSALSCIYLIITKMRERKSIPIRKYNIECATDRQILKKLITIAVPITIGASVMSLTNLIDMAVVMNRLQDIGFSESAASTLYGAHSMAITMFNLPQTLIVAISISIIPVISAAFARHNINQAVSTTQSALRIASMLALPAAAGLGVLSAPILHLIYYKQPQDSATATPLLSILAIAVIFVALVSLTNSILQAMGKIRVPVYSMLIGGLVKLVTNYVLVGIPTINILGAPIGTTLCYATIAILNLIAIRSAGVNISMTKIFVRPSIAAAVMGIFAYLIISPVSALVGAKIGVIITICLAGLLYGFMLLALHALPKEDVLLLPKGEKIAKILNITE